MIILLCWVLLAILVGRYAREKGPSGASFFFISVFLSPLIGFLIALLSSPQPEKAAQKLGMKRCSDCAEYVKQEARVCRFCGNRF
jgi:hypothetical protein